MKLNPTVRPATEEEIAPFAGMLKHKPDLVFVASDNPNAGGVCYQPDGTVKRYAAIWSEEVFVCPKCAHATAIEFAREDNDGYYCKYCYTSFDTDANPIETDDDDFDL